MKVTTDYRPNEAVLEKLRGIDFVAIIGPTAVGKTTLINALIGRHPSIQLIVTDVSRPPRPGERDGIDYHFRSRTEMLERIKRREYVNLAPSLAGDLYASHPDSYPEKGVGIMAVWADAVPYFRTLPFASFTQVYVLPPRWETLLVRIAERRFTPDQLKGRLLEIIESLQFATSEQNLAFVVNDDLEQAADDLWRIVSGQATKVTQNKGRTIAKELLKQL
jgi:guanylate kinase